MPSEFAPKTFNRCSQGLSREGHKFESAAILARISAEVEEMTPNDAVRLAQRILVSVSEYGIQQTNDFESPQAVEKYIRKAVNDLKGLNLA